MNNFYTSTEQLKATKMNKNNLITNQNDKQNVKKLCVFFF